MNLPTLHLSVAVFLLATGVACAQEDAPLHTSSAELQQQVDRLAAAVSIAQSKLLSSQQEIASLQAQIQDLQARLSVTQPVSYEKPHQRSTSESAGPLESEVERLREQQELQQSEIATQEQAKVETVSKFPLKLTGLILMNGFVNSAGVDVIQSPTTASTGGGATGFSLRQTVLGLDAHGPHILGASSSADIRADFFGGVNQNGYTQSDAIARLRTAHADLSWDRTRASFDLDRPIINPNSPTSLTAIANPALAWSGNLWNWIPQVGAEHSMPFGDRSSFSVQAALADIPDPPTAIGSIAVQGGASLAEQSRWPGSEARLGYARGDKVTGLRAGIGGYFSPHSEGTDFHFDAWAATIDFRVPLPARLEASGSFYRGTGLGGLGGGAFKDYLYRAQGRYDYYRALDDVGGWAQMKMRASQRLEFNAAYGIDNAFAGELRPYVTGTSGLYESLARNSTIFANVIYSPSSYTLFSFEYRRIDTSPVSAAASASDIYGIAAGYRF